MRAFVLSVIATLVITIVSASVLWMVPNSASDVYIQRGNVRL
jgi:hypothetical protein